MTIRQIANRIIKDIKAWPEEARQSQDIGGPKTSWDEYKEQIQYEEYDSFDLFEETIESMVRDDISELSDKVIDNLYGSIHQKNLPISIEEKREDLMNEVLCYIKNEAGSEDIEYNKIEAEFVRYSISDLTIVAEILSKVGPEEFIIRGYSEVTGAGGEQGVANISDLADEQGFEWISPDEFDRAKNGFKAEGVSSIKEIGSSETDIIDQNNDRQNAVEGKIESNDQAPLSYYKETPLASIGRNESGTGSNQQEASKAELVKPSHGESNTFFTKDVAEEAAGFIREELNNQNAGFNPKIALAGMTLAGNHIESGAKSFSDYVKTMVADIGPEIKPYLKQFYSMIRYEPGFDTKGMSSHDDVDMADIEKITAGIKLI